MNNIPDDFLVKIDNISNKRAKFVIDVILEKGQCTTEDIKNAGYEHAPRAARDVKELGIPLETKRVKDSKGKQIAAYIFGDWEEARKKNLLLKSAGRTQLTDKLKQRLIDYYGCRCNLYGESYPKRLLQPDHRIPYEIGGDPKDMMDVNNFMLLCPSANRDKSWACEHCSNWEIKDVGVCKQCYYAFPEKYNHIAGEKERHLHMIFKERDFELYDYLVERSNEENISIQDLIKRIIHYVQKKDDF